MIGKDNLSDKTRVFSNVRKTGVVTKKTIPFSIKEQICLIEKTKFSLSTSGSQQLG